MSRLRLVHGSGLVGRSESTIWWADGEELLDALNALSLSESSGFQALADAILDVDFDIGGVAAVDIGSGVAFVSGDAVLRSGDVVFDGSTTGTWIEQRLPNPEGIAVNATSATVDGSTDLLAGVVRGGGFVLGEPNLGSELRALESEAADQRAATAVDHRSNETIVIPAAGAIEASELLDDTVDEQSVPHAKSAMVASVEFDDGRHVDVHAGLVVGRNPVGEALPAGFDSVTVLDEFVSRRHWQLEVGPTGYRLRDLGSTSGTIVESGGETKTLSSDEAVDVGVEARVQFGDHWAIVKVDGPEEPERSAS